MPNYPDEVTCTFDSVNRNDNNDTIMLLKLPLVMHLKRFSIFHMEKCNKVLIACKNLGKKECRFFKLTKFRNIPILSHIECVNIGIKVNPDRGLVCSSCLM